MATGQFIHTNGGVGDTSYAGNSSYQRKVISRVKPMLEESVTSLLSTSVPTCFKAADLGCSSGPNALQVASNIIDIVDNISRSFDRDPPTLQFYLNDQFRNDFNTIFESLPEFYERLRHEKGDKFGSCFINATPGNFYGRLFPSNSIHFFHSSNCLHWLSQPPKGLAQGSEVINKANIYITSTSPPAVHQAYLEQFQQDFKLFLKSRAEELVPGGGMFLTFVGRDESCEMGAPWRSMSLALNDMVSENLIDEAKLDSFNMPRYGPTAEEVQELIEAEGAFTLQKLEIINSRLDESMDENANDRSRAEIVAKHVRATAEPLLKAHFGEGIINELFLRFRKKVVELIEEEKFMELASFVIFMIKK